MPTMPPELQAFFDEHKKGTCEQKRACHDQLGPIMAMADEAIAHLNALQSKLTAAELAPHDHALDGKFEWMHTRLRAAADCATAVRVAGRNLARAMVEVEASFNEDERNVNLVLAGATDAAPIAAPAEHVVITAADVGTLEL